MFTRNLPVANAPGKAHGPPTVERLAAAKALLSALLCECGWADTPDGVRIPYYDDQGEEIAVRTRTSLAGPDRFRWRKGDKAIPYGRWRLDQARKAGWLLLVEGETDTVTAWSHKIPCLGFPGASTAGRLTSEDLSCVRRVFAWKEPDVGGMAFAEGVHQRLTALEFKGEFYVIRPLGECKDLNELHQRHQGDPAAFRARLDHLMDCAEFIPLQPPDLRREVAELRRKVTRLSRLVATLAEREPEEVAAP